MLENGTLLTKRPLDFEKENVIQLDVSVSDGLHVVKTKIFINILDVNDNPPYFLENFYRFIIWADDREGKIYTDE